MLPRYLYWYKCFVEYLDRDNPSNQFEELAASLEDATFFRHWHREHHGNAE